MISGIVEFLWNAFWNFVNKCKNTSFLQTTVRSTGPKKSILVSSSDSPPVSVLLHGKPAYTKEIHRGVAK